MRNETDNFDADRFTSSLAKLEPDGSHDVVRERYINAFKDTMRCISEDGRLRGIVENSIVRTVCYQPDTPLRISDPIKKNGYIDVVRDKTTFAAIDLRKRYDDKKIAALNFASPTNPGGGVLSGADAQEESLCRCTTLYPSLNSDRMRREYYDVNREKRDMLGTDACIYTPDVVICRSDNMSCERLSEKNRVTIDVISCAAPNLRYYGRSGRGGMSRALPSDEELLRLHEKRARRIMEVAAANGVEVLLLGAFGCGAFRNDPNIVAQAFKNALGDMAKYFYLVEFAIFSADGNPDNYKAFQKCLI